jgi:endo-1,4-beta-xylanase
MNLRSCRHALLALSLLLLAGCPIPGLEADAGPDQVVTEGASVTLPASANVTDYIVGYRWTQTAGPQVKFKVSKKGALTFTAPSTEVQRTLTFKLIVRYQRGFESEPDTVDVTVNQIKFFGTATAAAADYASLLTWFDQVTPENAGKWGSVEATRDEMVWDGLDAAYQFAKSNGLPFKFHTLIWGQQQPGWIASLPAAEQLAEIEEWFTEVAARYPDIDLIDVVNEPINAPAGYREALGGAGATGYDWVITAFTMAREHFPNAKLIINEYNTVMLEQFTTTYMTVIGLLQERGLVDGIGEQGHFLERADPPVVAANLDTLASTGLPIYISELDLNFADDARQANVMRDLFPVFWDHPSVAGITHWGFRQGATWRPNAYLLRSDGTTRPAFDWISCYIGGGGDTCPVPEYVPAGWTGNEFGLTLEAEEYDDGEGVAALGNVVAFTDVGDWIAFKGVNFQQGWDRFWVNYSKGNTAAGSISIHIDDRESPAILTLDLPPTGGWNTPDMLEEAWTSLTGTHDVYINFHAVPGEGIANIDSVRFGKPLPTSGPNLVVDGGFETGIAGWSSWNGSALSASTLQAHSGVQSLRATSRPDANQFAVYNLTSVVQPNTTYGVSAWVFHTGAANDTVRLAAKIGCTSGDSFPWLQNNTAVAPNTWTQLSGNLVIPAACIVSDVVIFFEGTSPGSDVFVDDVSVIPPSNNLVGDGGFEAGIAGWSSWNGSALSASTLQARSGAQSLRATSRPDTNQFAVYNLTGRVQVGSTYAVTAWTLHTGAATDTVRLAAKVGCASGDSFPWLQNNTTVAPSTWTQLSGNLVIPAACTVVDVAIFFEGTTVGSDVFLDDVSVTPF